uniref:SJCHGC04018 protein n=1 Tax=Schistosoma japonicum TaxID=6182 RepID=Q5DHT5_SCHJA|nr:SJCHGC04018 protein [Schistosoma japonicum]
MYPSLKTEAECPVEPVKTGREFLNDLGHRIIVYLPGDRKIVVRGQLDQPVNNVLQEVSSERLIQLCDYYVINPKTGTNLDPKDTFLNQNADQIELKERKKTKSEENFLKLTGEDQTRDSKVKPMDRNLKMKVAL